MNAKTCELSDDEIDCVSGAGLLKVVATIIVNFASNAAYDAGKNADTSGGNTSQGQDQMGNMY